MPIGCFAILAADGEIVFEHGEISKIIAIPIIDDLEAEKNESFAVELYKTTGGANLGKHTRTVVTIINDDGRSFIESTAKENDERSGFRFQINGKSNGILGAS